jgi:transmembrane sensor
MTERAKIIGEEAVYWVVRLSSDQRTRADAEAFRAWLEENSAHAEAYADCAAFWDRVRDLSAIDEAHEILTPLRAPMRSGLRFKRRIAIFGGLSAALAAVIAAVVVSVMLSGQQRLQTAPGEQKRVRLADGTVVLLNTDSWLRVKFDASERRLFLDRGQVFFEVVEDKGRPFRVFAGNEEVRAIGTAFEVRRIGDNVRVTLQEGRVAIYHRGAAQVGIGGSPTRNTGAESVGASRASAGDLQPVVILSPGEQAVLASAEPITVREVDPRKVQAWRYGRMILDDAPLGETVADLNRYGGTQIVLADPKLASLRVSGVFHTGRPDDFVEAITSAFPVQIARQDENTIVLKPRQSTP